MFLFLCFYIFLRLWHCFYGHLAHRRIKKKRKFEPHSNKQREPLETIFVCVFSEVRDITFIHLNALKAVAAIWATKFVDASSSSSALQVDTNTLIESHSDEEMDALSAKLFSLVIHFHVYDAQLLGQELEFAKLTSKQLENVLSFLTQNNEFSAVLHQRSKLDLILVGAFFATSYCNYFLVKTLRLSIRSFHGSNLSFHSDLTLTTT